MVSHYGCNSRATENGSFAFHTGVDHVHLRTLATRCPTATGWGNASAISELVYGSPSFNLSTSYHSVFVNWTLDGDVNLSANTSTGAFADAEIFLYEWIVNSGGPGYLMSPAWTWYTQVAPSPSVPTERLHFSKSVNLTSAGYPLLAGSYRVYVVADFSAYAQSAPGGYAFAALNFASPGFGARMQSITVT